MNHRNITLVTTRPRLAQDFPGYQPTGRPMAATYPLHLDKIETPLGRWLAEHILTTELEDDASCVALESTATEDGLHFREIGKALMKAQEVSSLKDAESILAMVEARIAKLRVLHRVYENHCFTKRVITFDWPVYGSHCVAEAKTPEAYFDLCARIIQELDATIIYAGLHRATPPASLMYVGQNRHASREV